MTEWIASSSALILIVLGLRGILKGKISLKLQYGLWALVLVRLLVPFSLVQSAISVGNLTAAVQQQPAVQQARRDVLDYEEAYRQVVSRYEQEAAQPSAGQLRQETQDALYNSTYGQITDRYARSGQTVSSQVIAQETQTRVEAARRNVTISGLLPWILHGGMAVGALVLFGCNWQFGRKLRSSRLPMRIPNAGLPVYLSRYVATPCLVGFFRPEIYLTGEVSKDSRMREHVIQHELTHYRHLDHIWAVLRSLCLVLHWYNPLVWLAADLSRRDAELACDEATIRALGEQERAAYGRTLIGMTCVKKDPMSMVLTATTMLGSKKTLKERIMLIAAKPKTALVTLVACILVLSIAVGCTFTGAGDQVPRDVKDFYEEYLEVLQTDINRAILEYRHHEFVSDLHNSLNTPQGGVPTDLRILKWERLSDELWAVQLENSSPIVESMRLIWNFVGNIRGKYYVMINPTHVPEDLSQGVELSGFVHEDAMYPSPTDSHPTVELSTFTDAELIAFAKGYRVYLYQDSSWEDQAGALRDAIGVLEKNPYDTSHLLISSPELVNFMASIKAAYWSYHGMPCIHEFSHRELKAFLDEYGVTLPGDYASWEAIVRQYIYTIQFGFLMEEPPSDAAMEKLFSDLISAVQDYLYDHGHGDSPSNPTKPEPTDTLIRELEQLIREDYWLFRGLGVNFEDPSQIDLDYLVHTGWEEPNDFHWDNLSPGEQAFLLAHFDESSILNTEKLPAGVLNANLLRVLGVGLDQLSIGSSMVYYEPEDAYYVCNSSAYTRSVEILSARESDGVIEMDFRDPAGIGMETRYHIVLHDPVFRARLQRRSGGGMRLLSVVTVDAENLDEVENRDVQAQELVFFRELLSPGPQNEWYNAAMRMLFDYPGAISINELMYNGILSSGYRGWEDLTREEAAFAQQAGASVETDIKKLPVQQVDAILREYFSMGLSNFESPWSIYNPDTDAHYVSRSSTRILSDFQVIDVQKKGAWNYCIFYRVNEAFAFYDSNADEYVMFTDDPIFVMTLRKTDSGSYQIIANQTQERFWKMQEDIALFEALFRQSVHNEGKESYLNLAVTSLYEKPEDVDLYKFFYSAPSESVTQADLDYLGGLGENAEASTVHKFTVEMMDAVLRQYFGISFEDTNGVGLERMIFNPEGKCYYHIHGDYRPGYLTVISVQNQTDGTLLVHYIHSTADPTKKAFTITLVPKGDGYQVISNVAYD